MIRRHVPSETSQMVNDELSYEAEAKYVKLSQGICKKLDSYSNIFPWEERMTDNKSSTNKLGQNGSE